MAVGPTPRPESAVAELISACERLAADGPAAVRFTVQYGSTHAGLVRRSARRLLAAITTQRGVGVLDLARRRCRIEFSHTTLVVADECQRQGRRGTDLIESAAEPAGQLQPLWLCDMANGAVTAEGLGNRVWAIEASFERARGVQSLLAPPLDADLPPGADRVPLTAAFHADGTLASIFHRARAVQTTLEVLDLGVALPPGWPCAI